LGAIFISIFHLALGLSVTHFPFVLLASSLTREISIKNEKITPGCACGLILGLFGSTVSIEPPLIAGFVEYQHGKKSPAWSAKTTEGQASPSDSDKTAKIISDEGVL
jgi:hypothetical protein